MESIITFWNDLELLEMFWNFFAIFGTFLQSFGPFGPFCILFGKVSELSDYLNDKMVTNKDFYHTGTKEKLPVRMIIEANLRKVQ